MLGGVGEPRGCILRGRPEGREQWQGVAYVFYRSRSSDPKMSPALMVKAIKESPFPPQTERNTRQTEIHFHIAKLGPIATVENFFEHTARQVSEALAITEHKERLHPWG